MQKFLREKVTHLAKLTLCKSVPSCIFKPTLYKSYKYILQNTFHRIKKYLLTFEISSVMYKNPIQVYEG